ncbi:P-loop containing nucleoside triphosphate hydrolase protein, partial [Mycena leptocephala]
MSAYDSSSTGSPGFVSKSPSPSRPDWLAGSLVAAKAMRAAADSLPFPYVKVVFGSVVILLETVEKVKKNRDDLRGLCGDTVDIIRIVRDQIASHGDTAALKFKGLCEDLERCLQDILDAMQAIPSEPKGFRARLKEVIKLGGTASQITFYQDRIRTLRSNFVVHKLATRTANVRATQIVQSINNCPPPSKIFQGRHAILKKMHEYFDRSTGKQRIFLLYGLGGAGKTQIALKFIQSSQKWLSSMYRFVQAFLVDATTPETIEAALKNIAVLQKTGSAAQNALKWLSSHGDWVVLFDNADDPKLDLNKYFPKCNHGNILITSRNPGLQAHAGSHSHVSDMDEADAIEVLLTSSGQDSTRANKKTAAEIVKALWYLPLAIIQAGAFIAKSGSLTSYLSLYSQNRAQLLSEKPAQSHDEYSWTVYTTWQLSFNQLSDKAKCLLQHCSFLHHEGIYEKIFSDASKYTLQPYGPTKEELQEPLDFLSRFLGPNGVWDSFCFTDSMNELRGYSLIYYNSETLFFSLHPLVRSWTQSTMVDQEGCYHSVMAIVGMSMGSLPEEDKQLAALKLLPHTDALMQGGTDVRPDFTHEYGDVYLYSYVRKQTRAEEFYMRAIENRKKLLGEDHPHTLTSMELLAWTYLELDKITEAEQLNLLVLEKQKQVLGPEHPGTLQAMSQLAATYRSLERLEEAEELEAIVLEMRTRVLGKDHRKTLITMGNLAFTYGQRGKWKEAEKLHAEVFEKRKKLIGEEHLDTLRTMWDLAQ